VAAKHDLADPEGRVAYAQEMATVLAQLPDPVEREVYAEKVAQRSGISKEALLMEMDRAGKKQQKQQRRQLERENQNVIGAIQPKDRSIRYQDPASAVAEEGVIRLLLLDDTLLERCVDLTEEDFSSPMLGKLFALAQDAHREGRSLSTAQLDQALLPQERDHLSDIRQKPENLGKADTSLPDYIKIIKAHSDQRHGAGPEDPLKAAMEKNRDKKTYGGKHHGTQ
jgi:DNA primase